MDLRSLETVTCEQISDTAQCVSERSLRVKDGLEGNRTDGKGGSLGKDQTGARIELAPLPWEKSCFLKYHYSVSETKKLNLLLT